MTRDILGQHAAPEITKHGLNIRIIHEI